MKWELEKAKEWKYYEHPLGGTIPVSGTAKTYRTGGWRTFRPVRDAEKCTDCLICFIYCPDSAVKVENSKILEVDLTHCKGCGICAYECPKEAIKMVKEEEVG
jgi:pyruvate ferredoxin oxidoreductase delta subunit